MLMHTHTYLHGNQHTHTHLQELWLLDLEMTFLVSMKLFKKVKESFMLDYHFHLLLGCTVAMTNYAHDTTKL